jgi:ABC-type phosphate transport system auxiliary subunit
MANAEDLMQRLAVSRKIMEKTENIKRGDVRNINPPLEEIKSVEGNYNIPSEFLSESQSNTNTPSFDSSKPLDENKILSSKLPDEIKRLMIEKPIVQPSGMNGSANISEEVIQGAQRLMNLNSNKISEMPKNISEQINLTPQSNGTSNINLNEIKTMLRDIVRDTVRDVVREELKDAGMLIESTQDSNEVLQFKVGNHLFVGRITKIKKIEK